MMATLPAQVTSPSLSEAYAECKDWFRRFLDALDDEGCHVTRLEQVQLTQMLDEYGIARRKLDPALGFDQDSISSVSTDTESDSDDDGEHSRHRTLKICQLVKNIIEQIRSLYDLSSLLRRPKIADRHIRSINYNLDTAMSDNMGITRQTGGSSRLDERHIVEKVLLWRSLTKNRHDASSGVENIATIGGGLVGDGVQDILWYCQRLARANTRRREQLQYWAAQPYEQEKDTLRIPANQIEDLVEPQRPTVKHQSWKSHVLSDLRPYVCTFKDCQTSEKLYANSYDWIDHELQIHRRKYTCKECSDTCSSKDDMSRHLWKHYGGRITPAQVDVILDMCDNKRDDPSHEIESCLICGEELSLPLLQSHLAAHMEDIALFVLPDADVKLEAGGLNASIQGVPLESKAKTSGTDTEAKTLDFSASVNLVHPPAGSPELSVSGGYDPESTILRWWKADMGPGSASVDAITNTPESSENPWHSRRRLISPGLEASEPEEPRSPSPIRSLTCQHCQSTFANHILFQRHINSLYEGPYVCIFQFAGCCRSWNNKNEWRRHIWAHLDITYWVCTSGVCGQLISGISNSVPVIYGQLFIFKREECFTTHIRRTHATQDVAKADREFGQLPTEWVIEEQKLQEAALRQRCRLPASLRCPANGCTSTFDGPRAWDNHIEHVAIHLERVARMSEPPLTFGGAGDEELIKWASSSSVGVIERTEGGWRICQPHNGAS
ncbi:hypothetical protein FSARC_7376 [Fusarium sarcochroum]|uniref:C2H2-type domain-containing protein n=1 Tax=Fusarium sarcochroum TaxID=1208366 RepID=A0A8H4TVI4_9HYPO|nr:hypothetical protein FSARC_7376 [Fusarium sarcochroum]